MPTPSRSDSTQSYQRINPYAGRLHTPQNGTMMRQFVIIRIVSRLPLLKADRVHQVVDDDLEPDHRHPDPWSDIGESCPENDYWPRDDDIHLKDVALVQRKIGIAAGTQRGTLVDELFEALGREDVFLHLVDHEYREVKGHEPHPQGHALLETG